MLVIEYQAVGKRIHWCRHLNLGSLYGWIMQLVTTVKCTLIKNFRPEMSLMTYANMGSQGSVK